MILWFDVSKFAKGCRLQGILAQGLDRVVSVHQKSLQLKIASAQNPNPLKPPKPYKP